MRRLWGLSLLALVIALLSLGSAAAQGGDELLVNGNFAQGTAGWTFNIASTCGSCWIDVLGDDSGPERNMLMWERTNSGNNGSAIWAQQRVDADVSRYGSLWLTVQLRVLQHSLSNSGWWSDMHNGNGEYPVQVTLRFADRGGQLFEWSHGFLTVHDGSTALRNYTLVPAGEWTTYSADLFLPAEWTDPRGMALPTAARSGRGGSSAAAGWDFSGAIKSISIMGSPSQGRR